MWSLVRYSNCFIIYYQLMLHGSIIKVSFVSLCLSLILEYQLVKAMINSYSLSLFLYIQRSHTLRCPMSSSSSLIADNGNLGDTCLGLFLAGGLTPSQSSSDNMTTLSFASRSLQLNFSTSTACCLAQDSSTVLEGYLFDELSSNLWMSLRIYEGYAKLNTLNNLIV